MENNFILKDCRHHVGDDMYLLREAVVKQLMLAHPHFDAMAEKWQPYNTDRPLVIEHDGKTWYDTGLVLNVIGQIREHEHDLRKAYIKYWIENAEEDILYVQMGHSSDTPFDPTLKPGDFYNSIEAMVESHKQYLDNARAKTQEEKDAENHIDFDEVD